MTQGRRSGSDLPAEYEDPWRLLRRDLRAVLASLRLRLWELWRRNGEGDLWRPRFWPDPLAPLFWPVLLALLLFGLPAGLFAGLTALRPAAPAGPAPQAPLAPRSEAVPVAPAEPGPTPAPGPPAPGPAAAPGPSEPSEPAAAPEPVPEPVPAPAAAEPPPPDPLLRDLGEPPGASLLGAARSEPARSLLLLTAQPGYARLPEAERRERAEAWWRRGQELGYEHLELRDGSGALLARSALVGGGLLLFEAPPPGTGGTASVAADPA